MNRIISEKELKLLKEAFGKKEKDNDDFDYDDIDFSNIESMGYDDSSTLNTNGVNADTSSSNADTKRKQNGATSSC